MSEIVVVKYLFKEDWAPFEEVMDKNAKDFGDVHDVDSEKDVVQVISASPATLVLLAITGKDDLTKAITFLKTQRRLIKDSNAKVSVVNYLNNKQVETALMKLGCQEVMEPSIRSKALKFKMDFWKKALSLGQNRNYEQKVVQKEKTFENKVEANKAEAPAVKWIDSLKHVDDMWITKNTPQDAKRVLNRWLVKVTGPSPFVAQWVEVQGQRGVWQFTFKTEDARGSFHAADGDWFFTGDQKPEFIWKENVWLVSGQKFQLYYQEEDETVTRFRASPQTLEICKTSNYAQSREKSIIETFDQEVLVKKGLLDNSKTEIEKEDDPKDGLLTQDISDEGAIDSHYKGKVENELPDAPKEKKISAKADRLGGNYDGETGTDDLGTSHYDGELDHQKSSKKERQGLDARSDRMGNSDGDAGTDDVGPSKYKGKLEHGHSERKSDYGGESETDDLGDSHWSNKPGEKVAKNKKHREREEFEAELEESEERAERERKGYKEGAKRGYSGESDTDDLGEDHWSNKKSDPKVAKEKQARPKAESQNIWDDEEEQPEEAVERKRKKAAAEKKKGEWTEEEESGPLSGKSHTDDLGDDYYSGKDEKKKRPEKVAKEKSRFEDEDSFEEEDEDSFEKSESSANKKRSKGTDNLGPAHYGGKISRTEELEEEEEYAEAREKKKKQKKERGEAYVEDELEDYSGESSTDKLDRGPLSGKVKKKTQNTVQEETEEEEFEEVPKIAARRNNAAIDRKMSMLDDLLPEGNAEDPQGDVVPSDFEEAPKVHVPVARTKPRLVTNNEEEVEEEEEATRTTAKRKESAKPVPPALKATLESEAVDDNGRQIVNESVVVKAVLKRKADMKVEHIVQLDDFFDNTVILRVPRSSVSAKEQIELTMTFEYMKRSKRISVSGVCVEMDVQDSEGYCTIELQASDLKIFEQFMLLYQLRQQHVHQFIKAVKGL